MTCNSTNQTYRTSSLPTCTRHGHQHMVIYQESLHESRSTKCKTRFNIILISANQYTSYPLQLCLRLKFFLLINFPRCSYFVIYVMLPCKVAGYRSRL